MDRNMKMFNAAGQAVYVATREGGVDRNIFPRRTRLRPIPSPPARVAWIETCAHAGALRGAGGRHPRGWRG